MLFRTQFNDEESKLRAIQIVEKLERKCNPRYLRVIPGRVPFAHPDPTLLLPPERYLFHCILRPKTDPSVADLLFSLEVLVTLGWGVQWIESDMMHLGHLRDTYTLILVQGQPTEDWHKTRGRIYLCFQRWAAFCRVAKREKRQAAEQARNERLRPLRKPPPEGRERPYVDESTGEIWTEDLYFPSYSAYRAVLENPGMSRDARDELLLAFVPKPARPALRGNWADAMALVEQPQEPQE